MATFGLSTGVPGLDRILKGLIPGDNLVWHVDQMDDFRPFAAPFAAFARQHGSRVVYFRFADHPPLLTEDDGVEVHQLNTGDGFEQFITDIHKVLHDSGRRACFVFDCLSQLAEDWCSDAMLGNFFMLTCPYVFDLESLAFFPLLRGRHSFQAVTPISETTQIFLEVYRYQDRLYLQPSKVQHRYSTTMYTLHAWDEAEFVPVRDSSTIAEILTSMPWGGLDSARFRLGPWNRAFLEAEETARAVASGERSAEDAADVLHRLLRMAVTRDPRMLALVEKYLTLDDVLGVLKRMIGTGLIGGKAVGMLLARAILKRADPRWNGLLEAHDSFHIGSDVFYSFLVRCGCWWLRQRQRDKASFLDGVEEARRRILMGEFPPHIERDFADMLDYFGQSPIIVRSSSLLEDNYGNAFAGKYESVFCANQGPHHKRLQDFMSAVKTIYASTMSENALRYRAQRGLLELDEQMSLLVQRVCGVNYGSLFYPHVAGVGMSRNPYVWHKAIDPKAGVVRLVFGLGTRAVDRSDDDYTRVVALNAPSRRPESDADEVCQYSQHKVDVIDLAASQRESCDFAEVVRQSPDLPLAIFATPDRPSGGGAWFGPGSTSAGCGTLTFDSLLSETRFVGDMRDCLATLHAAYDHPVETEFVANFLSPQRYRINLVQCRPMQVAAGGAAAALPEVIAPDHLVLEAHGAVIGQSRLLTIDRVVYVTPAVYGQLPLSDRYTIARLIGRVLHLDEQTTPRQVLLIGPGRWGTTTPSLGVPVAFAEIDRVAALCEIVAMRDDLVPDVSLGTHFFHDLVEQDILYLALFPERPGNGWNRHYLETAPNRLEELLPDAKRWSEALRIIDVPVEQGNGWQLKLNANSFEQMVVCYRQAAAAETAD